MTVFAIDPGSSQSGVVTWDGGRVLYAGVLSNHEVLNEIQMTCRSVDVLAIEEVGHFGTGMPAGKDVFRTVRWAGRFEQCWAERRGEESVQYVLRPTIKTHLCGTPRAKDANVGQALRDRIGPKGTQKNKGPLYGVTSHAIQALALAVYVTDMARIGALERKSA